MRMRRCGSSSPSICRSCRAWNARTISFYRQYLLNSGEGWGEPSPYFDGEILLALVKAARYLQRDDLQPLVLRAAEASYAAHARDAIAAAP